MSDKPLRVIVLGYIVRGPLGGLVWHHLQYVLGLLELGYDAWFIEDSEDYPACYDPRTDSLGTDPSYGLEFCRLAFSQTGAGERWTYFDAHTRQWLGPAAAGAEMLIRSADIVLNISGVNPLRGALADIPVRVLIDTDPVFTQLRHLAEPPALAQAQQHNSFFTFGESFGLDDCSIPDDGLPWMPTRQPVVLHQWDGRRAPPGECFTTVMQWESYPERNFAGKTFGMKSRSFRDYIDLPSKTGKTFELAVGSPSAPKQELALAGWRIANPLQVTETPWTYQDYILRSKAEFSVAKHGYVTANSGWFSERSACYLASGRPVITQDTGFSRFLPHGEGLHSFRNPEEAMAGIEAVCSQYVRNCQRAREIAEECFRADKVLTDLMARITTPFAVDSQS